MVMETRTRTLFFITPKYSDCMQYYTMLLEQFDYKTGKGPGYCYMIGRGPNCCFLGHVTGLLFCLYVKIFLPSIFNLIHFRNSMYLIVLDIELTGKNINEELVFLLMVLYMDFHFVHQRLINLLNRRHGTQVIYMK